MTCRRCRDWGFTAWCEKRPRTALAIRIRSRSTRRYEARVSLMPMSCRVNRGLPHTGSAPSSQALRERDDSAGGSARASRNGNGEQLEAMSVASTRWRSQSARRAGDVSANCMPASPDHRRDLDHGGAAAGSVKRWTITLTSDPQTTRPSAMHRCGKSCDRVAAGTSANRSRGSPSGFHPSCFCARDRSSALHGQGPPRRPRL